MLEILVVSNFLKNDSSFKIEGFDAFGGGGGETTGLRDVRLTEVWQGLESSIFHHMPFPVPPLTAPPPPYPWPSPDLTPSPV